MDTAVLNDSFLEQVEPLRRELTAHCYRMLGSVHDAEDLVQETYLRAWRAYDRFEARSSLRTWLYRIATNACLTALQNKERRMVPSGLGQSPSEPEAALRSLPEATWLEPLPDTAVWAGTDTDPESTVVTRDSVRLAFIAALQHLTAQQRAALILRDVLAWRASEVAEVLNVSVAAVNSSLQRARANMAQLDPEPAPHPDDERARTLLERYVAAFENYDIDSIVSLLATDAVWEMPPFTGWYQGSADIGRLIAAQCPASGPGDIRMVRTFANGQPALAMYMLDSEGVHRAFHLQQLTLTGDRVSRVTCFFDTGLFERFGLPMELRSEY